MPNRVSIHSKQVSIVHMSLYMPERPTATEATSGEQSQSRRHHRAASSTPSEQSYDGSSSPHPHTKDRLDHSRRKTEKFIRVQDLD